MHIRLNVKPNLDLCAYVYAWSDDKPEVAYKFWHNDSNRSLQSHQKVISCDDDYYVDFRSNVPLNKWLYTVKRSKFNKPREYHHLHHNCAIAATFALEVAGIKLFENRSYIFLSRVSDYSFARIPLHHSILTPYDVLDAARAKKLSELKQNKMEKKYSKALSELKKGCGLFGIPREKELARKIADEIQKRHLKHPEHTEAQIDALMQTLRILKHMPDESASYLESANQFKQRKLTQAGKSRERAAQLYLIFLGLALLFYLCDLQMLLNSKTNKFSFGNDIA